MKLKQISVIVHTTLCLMLFTLLSSPAMAQDDTSTRTVGGVKSMEERIRELERTVGLEDRDNQWFDRIGINGFIEFEASHSRFRSDDPDQSDHESSDLDLGEVGVAVEADISTYADGLVLFKYEDDDLFVEEAFITLSGESFPGWLKAGRQCIPFGVFESHFVTDPLTLELGETFQGAAVAGYRFAGDTMEISAGLFNGAVDETDKDDMIDSMVAAVTFQPYEFLEMGLSYTSNLLSADAFSEFAANSSVDELVGGWSGYVAVSFLERFAFIAEYLTAMDHFKAGEIYDATDTRERKPAAWNLELGVSLLDNVELAIGYGGSDDGGTEFLPESRYGVVANWGIFDNTNLALEYLKTEFEDNAGEIDTITMQLAIEF